MNNSEGTESDPAVSGKREAESSSVRESQNIPPHNLRPGLALRHEAMSISHASNTYRMNSVLSPGIVMATEVNAINEGHATRLPNNRYRINNRIWIDKGDGYTFPESGDDVWEFNSAQFDLLRAYIRDGGRSERTVRMIEKHPRLNDDLAAEVEALFVLIEAFRRKEQ